MTKEKTKILIIIPSLGGGGAERILINLLKLMDYDRYAVDLWLVRKRGILLKEVPDAVNIHAIFDHKWSDRISSLSYMLLGVSQLMLHFGKKITGEYELGMCFMDSVYSDFLFFNNASFKRRALVIHSSYLSYSNNARYRKGKHRDRMESRYQQMDSIITVSKESMSEFKKVFGEYKDMRVIYNPLNTTEILAKSKKEKQVFGDNPSGAIQLLAAGRLIPVKGYERLIEACALVQKEVDNFKLTILGEGSLKEKLQEQITQLKLDSHVVLKGFTKNPYPWIDQTDVFVMTSIAEGLPTSLCEAMVLKKPVLVTNVPGCREITDHGNYGMMVEESVEAIADGLLRLIKEEALRTTLAAQAEERAKVFDDDKALESYYSIFDNPKKI